MLMEACRTGQCCAAHIVYISQLTNIVQHIVKRGLDWNCKTRTEKFVKRGLKICKRGLKICKTRTQNL